MARKKVEKAHWTPDEKLRPLMGREDDDDQHLKRERVVLTLDDAGLRKMQHEIVAVREELAPLKNQAEALKRQMKEKQDREKALMEAMVAGTLTEWRQVYAYANDAEQLVQLYDPIEKTLIATRALAHYERQMEFDYGPTKVRGFDPEAPKCPENSWDTIARCEDRDEDGKQAWLCEDCGGVLMLDPASGEGLFYEGDESDEADDDDQESGDDDE